MKSPFVGFFYLENNLFLYLFFVEFLEPISERVIRVSYEVCFGEGGLALRLPYEVHIVEREMYDARLTHGIDVVEREEKACSLGG